MTRPHRLARVRAAELNTSVSALVRRFLASLVAGQPGSADSGVAIETDYQRRCRLLREVLADFEASGAGLRMFENIPRDALYQRGDLAVKQ